MNLIQYIAFRLDKAIEILMDENTTKTECALYLMDFKKQLFKPEKVIVDEDKTKYLEEKNI